ncbi:DUF2970 domain-containing protein [Chitinibacter fontanus]|uniref:DUF2970 domain-containing protein n=1 Tax=Chitinibacter fontanus TaxID=1737446 RepID=A0A7D5VA45_9NEIS|nr:DUF2970 domain-containing protein [Chitinibacter fontanus]QLI81380.1 DUF2970 domain-containing protein [Chitinibacter fontanus]
MWTAIKAVLAAFFGVRSREKSRRPVQIWQLLVAGLLCGLLLALLVWGLVHTLVTTQQ